MYAQMLLPEILSRVMEMAIEEPVQLWHNAYIDHIRPQRRSLRLISRHWNSLVLQTPSLWTHIHVDFIIFENDEWVEQECKRI